MIEHTFQQAMACHQRGALADAERLYRAVLAQRPNDAVCRGNLGNLLAAQGRLEEGIMAFEEALRVEPHMASLHYNLGTARLLHKEFAAAEACFRRTLELAPDMTEAYTNLGGVLQTLGYGDEALACLRKARALDPENPRTHSNFVFQAQFHPDWDAVRLGDELRRWRERFADPLKAEIRPHANDRSPERRLHVGYVSPDFRDHPVGRQMLSLFKHVNHAQFISSIYADVRVPDALTEDFRRRADRFHVVAGLPDQALAERIRADGIDILVDLALHSAGNRLLVFARKSAPVQVTFAGYPGSTGLSTIDYRLTDPSLEPAADDGAVAAAEKPWRLASFWCYEAPEDAPPVGAPPCQTNGFVTFGCLTSFSRINAGVLQRWASILADVPTAHLVMLAPLGQHRERTLAMLERLGVAPRRVRYEAPQPRAPYFKLYHQIDIGLDTLPYNGHTTSLDSLFMGVPVVTLVGQTVVGRGGLSQLTNLGLPELIASSPEEYVHIAATLAANLPRLAALRSTLRDRMRNSPLMDAPGWTRNIEAAYRQMWQTWCAAQTKP